MATIIIPKKLIKEKDLVLIPRKEYEKFLSIFEILPKNQWWFWTKEWQKKEREAGTDILQKKISGPYKTKKELKIVLKELKK